ncbi:hypothetical protein L798_10214 [Zootermopsis nevadensis]|uniref:Uncharacterized protein n=1 Tax=Zootermopsis nevadensis TaxID=136037 RepID=A0A067QYG9_ZOONE|nr:hypothetical protein L798_10214 [Zootermopsis nevadensis]
MFLLLRNWVAGPTKVLSGDWIRLDLCHLHGYQEFLFESWFLSEINK